MDEFEEFKDYEFVPASEMPTISKNHPSFACIAIKDSADYSNYSGKMIKNKTCYLVIKSNDLSFVKNCVSYAVRKHLPELIKYQAEILLNQN